MNKVGMTKRAVASLTVALFMAVGAASAAEKPAEPASKSANVTGKVHSVDVVNEVVRLENGQYYMIPPTIKLDELKVGDQVTMSVDVDQYGTNHAKTLTKN